MALTKEQIAAGLAAVEAIATAIMQLGEVPSGVLYARVMSHLNVQQYDAIVGTLKRAKLVEERAHVLRWIGPKLEAK